MTPTAPQHKRPRSKVCDCDAVVAIAERPAMPAAGPTRCLRRALRSLRLDIFFGFFVCFVSFVTFVARISACSAVERGKAGLAGPRDQYLARTGPVPRRMGTASGDARPIAVGRFRRGCSAGTLMQRHQTVLLKKFRLAIPELRLQVASQIADCGFNPIQSANQQSATSISVGYPARDDRARQTIRRALRVLQSLQCRRGDRNALRRLLE